MFVWIQLDHISDSFELISTKCVDAGVLLVPGKEFYPVLQKSNCVRASYSYATFEAMEEGVKRLSLLI